MLRQTILATKEKTLSWGKRPPRSAVFCKAKKILVEEYFYTYSDSQYEILNTEVALEKTGV